MELRPHYGIPLIAVKGINTQFGLVRQSRRVLAEHARHGLLEQNTRADPKFVELLAGARLPRVQRLGARRLAADQRQTVLTLKDGRTLSGAVRGRSTRTVTLQSVGETNVIAVAEIEREETSNQSLMPDGLLESLEETQARALIRYLMTRP